MATASVPCSIRRQLLTLVGQRRWNTEFTPGEPKDWRPEQVRNPAADSFFGYFTQEGAWELIASKLESGHHIETIRLRKPAGKTGYVMKIMLEDDAPLLYVKLQLGRGEVIGRSFHYSGT